MNRIIAIAITFIIAFIITHIKKCDTKNEKMDKRNRKTL